VKERAWVSIPPNHPDDELPWPQADARAVDLISVLEWFAGQDACYQETVLPAQTRARVSVEAASALGWRGFVGDAGDCESVEHFGESAGDQTWYAEFGLTAEHAVTAAKATPGPGRRGISTVTRRKERMP
jgi:transketolase